jgi:hypothetical protein
LISSECTIGAPQVVRHLVLADRVEDRLRSTLRRHTLVPALAAIVHAKHQPLQWNSGSVHKVTPSGAACPSR